MPQEQTNQQSRQSTDRRVRNVRDLLKQDGRTFAQEAGIRMADTPAPLYRTLVLATMLSVLNSPSRKILTIEDSVEYEIPGINQTQVKPAIGLTFAAAMRSFVRQDPDVIMVG